MAEPLKILQEIRAIIQATKGDLDAVKSSVVAISKEAREAKNNFNFKTPKDVSTQVQKTKTFTEQLNAELKEQERLQKALATQIAKKKQALSSEGQQLQKIRFETQQLNRQMKEEAVLTSKLSTFYQKQNVILNRLTKRRQDLILKQKLGIKLSKAEVAELNKLTIAQNKLDAAFKDTDAQVGRNFRSVGNYGKALSGLKNIVTGLIGAFGVFEGIRLSVQFTKEALALAREAKGVEFAFNRLGEAGENAFARVRGATRGLVSNLDIKKALVDFDNFNISLEESDILFEFLAVRAAQTGQSIDKLRDSLVEGLSKESKLRIDNLGISASELNNQLEKTPDFVKAVAEIAKREVKEAGNILDEAANGGERLAASFENAKLSFGQLFEGEGASFLSVVADMVEEISVSLQDLNKALGVFSKGLSDLFAPMRKFSKEGEETNNRILKLTKTVVGFLVPIAGLSDKLDFLSKILNKIGRFFSGFTASIKTAKAEVSSFFSGLSELSEIDIDLLDLRGTSERAKKVFQNLKQQFQKGGKEIAESFNRGYNSGSAPDLGGIFDPNITGDAIRSVNTINEEIEKLSKQIAEADVTDIKHIRTLQDKKKALEDERDAILGVTNSTKDHMKAVEGSVKWYEELISKMKENRDYTAKNTLEYREQTREIEELEEKVNDLKKAFEGVGKITAEAAADLDAFTDQELQSISELEEHYLRILAAQKAQRDLRIEGMQQEADLWDQRIDMAAQALAAIDALAQGFFQREMNRLDEKSEALNEYYDGLLENERLTDSQRDAIENERDQKEAELQRKREEAEKKAFLTKQAFALGQIAIDLARTITAINAAAAVMDILSPGAGLAYRATQIPFAIGTAAAQTAIVVAQTIPEFAEGKKESDSYEGAMIWGEKRPEVKLSKDGSLEVATKPTLGYTRPGDTIFPSFEAFGKSDIYNQAMALQLSEHSRRVGGFQSNNTEALIKQMIDKMGSVKVENHNHIPKNKDIDKLARKMALIQKANKI